MQISIFTIAKKNIKRKAFRSIAIALSVSIVADTLFVVTTIMESVERSLKKGTSRLGADIMVVPADSESDARTALLAGDPSTFYMDKGIKDQVKKIEGVRAISSQIYLRTSQYECCDVGDMLLIGFDQKNDFTIIPWLTEKLNRPLTDEEAIMGPALTAFMVGNSIRFYGAPFKVIGMLEKTGMKFIDNSVFIPFEAVDKIVESSKGKSVADVDLMANQISTVLVQVDPDYSPSRVAIFIEYAVPGVKSIVSEQVISSVRRQLFILLRSIISITLILWIMALLLIGVVFSMIVNERQREIGLLRAMGARRRNIFDLIITEASVISFLGGIFGIVMGGTTLFLFKDFIQTALRVPYLWPSAFEFIILIIICLILSFFYWRGRSPLSGSKVNEDGTICSNQERRIINC